MAAVSSDDAKTTPLENTAKADNVEAIENTSYHVQGRWRFFKVKTMGILEC
jgi:hypothetical protein